VQIHNVQRFAPGRRNPRPVFRLGCPMHEHLAVLRERHKWLAARIQAKRQVGWETQWDEREHNALAWAIEELDQWSRKPITFEELVNG
jgi:hypothetical protein